jgi:hypothetical protein
MRSEMMKIKNEYWHLIITVKLQYLKMRSYPTRSSGIGAHTDSKKAELAKKAWPVALCWLRGYVLVLGGNGIKFEPLGFILFLQNSP